MSGWLKKHAYALLLAAVLLVAILVSVREGRPKSLPDVALGWDVLLHAERAFAILIASFFILVILVRAWKGELPYKLSRDGFEFEAAVKGAAQASEGTLPAEKDPDEPGDDRSTPDSAITLRLRLEAKLTYIAKHMLAAEDCCATYVTVGSLRVDGYITDREAETLSQVLTMRDDLLDASPVGQRSEFLRDANNVVKNIRASVFYALVQKMLESNGWEPEPILTKRKRADFHATRGNDRQFRVVPRFATDEKSSILSRELERLEAFSGERSIRGRTLIVVPDRSRSELDPEGDPAVLKLSEFRRLLALEADPRSTPRAET